MKINSLRPILRLSAHPFMTCLVGNVANFLEMCFDSQVVCYSWFSFEVNNDLLEVVARFYGNGDYEARSDVNKC